MIDLIATDTMFPEYRYGMDTDEYLRENNNYLFLLREDLNYALHNLGIANFNSRQLEVISGKITEPLYNRLEDDEGRISSLSYDYGLIEARVSDNEESISQLSIEAETIRATVYGVEGDEDSGLTHRLSQVEVVQGNIAMTVADISDDYISATTASQTSDGFSLTVADASGQTVTMLDRDGLNIYGGALSLYSAGTEASNRVLYADNSGNLYIKGRITATELSLGDGVTIDASKLSGILNTDCIQNGTITGSMIQAGSITSSNIQSGAITATQIASGTITSTQIASNTITANNIQTGTITGTQIAANTITGNKIYAGTITGDKLAMNTVTAYNIDATNLQVHAANITGTLTANQIRLGGTMAVYQNLTDTFSVGGYIGYAMSNIDGTYGMAMISSSYNGFVTATDNGARISYGSITSPASQVYCSYKNLSEGGTAGFAAIGAVNNNYTVRMTGSTSGMYFAPYSYCSCSIGAPTDASAYSVQPFDTGYVYSAIQVVSDRKMKHDIDYDVSRYDAVFDGLRPASFLYNNGTSGRRHTAFIAQDVEQAVLDAGLTLMDFAAVTFSEDEQGNRGYFMRNEELIALCVRQIQMLKARVAALEGA